jgi:hypothetical protein
LRGIVSEALSHRQREPPIVYYELVKFNVFSLMQ